MMKLFNYNIALSPVEATWATKKTLTGSRVLGGDKPTSDWDYLARLSDFRQSFPEHELPEEPGLAFYSLRGESFRGRWINLILPTTEELYQSWRLTTLMLVSVQHLTVANDLLRDSSTRKLLFQHIKMAVTKAQRGTLEEVKEIEYDQPFGVIDFGETK